MEILKEIWDADAEYALIDGILQCWWKANILPIGWKINIENEVEKLLMSKNSKTLSDIDYAELCSLFRKGHASA